MSRIIKKIFNESIKFDYLSWMSFKHAHNLVINEEKLLVSSYLTQNINLVNQPKAILIVGSEQDEINWLNSMSIKQSYN